MGVFFTNLQVHVGSRRPAESRGAIAIVLVAVVLAVACGDENDNIPNWDKRRWQYSEPELKMAAKPDLWVDSEALHKRYPQKFIDFLTLNTISYLAVAEHADHGKARGEYLLENVQFEAPVEMWGLDVDRFRVAPGDPQVFQRIHKSHFLLDGGEHWLVPVLLKGVPTDASYLVFDDLDGLPSGGRYSWKEGFELRKSLLERRAKGARLVVVECCIQNELLARYWVVLEEKNGAVNADCYSFADTPDVERVGPLEMGRRCVRKARLWRGEDADAVDGGIAVELPDKYDINLGARGRLIEKEIGSLSVRLTRRILDVRTSGASECAGSAWCGLKVEWDEKMYPTLVVRLKNAGAAPVSERAAWLKQRKWPDYELWGPLGEESELAAAPGQERKFVFAPEGPWFGREGVRDRYADPDSAGARKPPSEIQIWLVPENASLPPIGTGFRRFVSPEAM